MNNLFLDNRTITESALPRGTNLCSEQPFDLLGNTFHRAYSDVAAIYLPDIKFMCYIKNNIFSMLPAVFEQHGEVDAHVVSNSFYGAENVLLLDGTPMGDDAGFVDLMRESWANNHNWEPGFVGELVTTGTLSANPAYDWTENRTVFAADGEQWQPDQFAGAVLSFSAEEEPWPAFPIVSNGEDRIWVRGNLTSTTLGVEGSVYTISDYHLTSSSLNIDSGVTMSNSSDFDGERRPMGSGYDIGADEYTNLMYANIPHWVMF